MSQFVQTDEVQTKMQLRHMFMQLWPFAKVFWKLGLTATILMLLSIISARLLPQTIGYAIDHGVLEKNVSVLIYAAWVYLGLQTLHAVSQFGYLFLFQKFGNRVLADLREKLVGHVQGLPLDYFHRNPVGRIVTRLTNDPANLNEVFSEGAIAILSNFLILVSLVVSMLLISVKLTLITLALMPFFLWVALKVSYRIRVILRESKKKLADLSSYASESLQGMRVLQILGAVSYSEKRFNGTSLDYQNVLLRSIKAYALMQPLLNLFTAIVVTSALAGGGYFTLQGELAIGSLVAFLLHAQDFIPPLREMLEKYQQFQNSLTSAERVFHLFEEAPEESLRSEPMSTSSFFDPLVAAKQNRSIEFRNLSFRYAEDQPYVLENLNLTIHPGERVALMGRTGAGKSTVISLLQRFYELRDDSLLIGGIPINQVPRHELRRWIGVVQQDPVLFRGTIADNLSLGDPLHTREVMEQALRRMGAWDFFQRSGRTLDFWVEERGANLSVGERQLICFARILVSNPAFLILDEATANVDSETESFIQKAIQETITGRTCLIIAHRLSTLKDCNRFIKIEQGRAVETTLN
jgi:ATP-binding cassette subfamily B protein